MASGFGGVLRRDLKLGLRRRGELINPMVFFLLVVSLFPLGVGPEPGLLAMIAPGVIWVAALLATMLSLERLYRDDFDDGSLEQMLLSPHPLALLVLAKSVAHWLLTGLPLLVMSPLLAVLMGLNLEAMGVLALSLLLGTPVLSLLGSIAVSLTVGLSRGGVLLALLLLPLYIPTLIFGTAAVVAAADGLPAFGQLMLLASLLAGTLTLAPFAAALGLRISLS